MTKWKVCLCANCIKDLDDYYPYVVPRNQLDITEVPEAECDNKDLEGYNFKLSQRNQIDKQARDNLVHVGRMSD